MVLVIAAAGDPLVVTSKLPAAAVVNVVVAALVKLGAIPLTVISTVAGLLVWVPLETAREKMRVVGPVGAVKLGVAVEDPVRVTAGPAVCSQAYSSGRLFGSQLSDPSRLTEAPELTVCEGPTTACGVGSSLGTRTITSSASLVVAPSLTVSEKPRTVGCEGVVNFGFELVELLSETLGPLVWVQA